MAMTVDSLATRMATELDAVINDPLFNLNNPSATRTLYLKALAKAIIDEIHTNASITAGGTHTYNGDGTHTHVAGTIT